MSDAHSDFEWELIEALIDCRAHDRDARGDHLNNVEKSEGLYGELSRGCGRGKEWVRDTHPRRYGAMFRDNVDTHHYR